MKNRIFPILLLLIILILDSCKNKFDQKSQLDDSTMGVTEVDVLIDPVCRMDVSDYASDTVIYKNAVYKFCSKGCKAVFKETYEKFTVKK